MSWNAHVWVKCSNEFKMNGDWNWLNEWKGVKRAWSTMGDWDLCFEVDADSADKLEEFVWNNLKKQNWVSETHTTWTREVWANA